MMNVIWLFRKKRSLGNFSIENSFDEVKSAWKEPGVPTWHEVSHYSIGVIHRWRIIRETRQLKAQILHITGDINFAALAWPKWKRNRPKVVLTIHDIGFMEEFKGVNKWLMQKFWVEWPLRCVDHVVVVSEATKQAVIDVAPWFPDSAFSVISTVVPQHFRARSKQPENPKPIALHIGLAANKNLERHVKALRKLNVHLRIIGEPGQADLIMLQASGIEFSWKARLSDEEMQAEYTQADFLLFASTLEGFGMPIIEAQMVGVPVITSDIEPMKSIAGDGAKMCNPLNSASIREAVELLLESKATCERLIELGFKNAQQFDPKEAVQAHIELYANIGSMQRY